MKLLKLSLATALAAGSLATASFATPLEEAIKNVDLSGSVMLRYDYIDKDTSSSKWKVKGVLNFKTAFDDNFFAFAGLKIDDTDDARGKSSSSGRVDLYNAYIGYTNGGTTILAGRQDAGTFFTDDLYGDGVKIVNTDAEGLTLAALWLDNFNDDGDIATIEVIDAVNDSLAAKGEPKLKQIYQHDLFGVAAIGSYDPVNFQAWYARLSDVADLMALELGFDFDLGNGSTLGILGQWGRSDIDGKFRRSLGDNVADGKIYAGQISLDVQGFELSGGYVRFATDKGKASLNSLEDKGGFISAGEQTANDYQLYNGKNNMWFVTASVGVPDTGFSIGADYVDLGAEEFDSTEVVGRIGYKYSKKLNFTSYYSHLDVDKADKDAKPIPDSNKFRFQVKYSF